MTADGTFGKQPRQTALRKAGAVHQGWSRLELQAGPCECARRLAQRHAGKLEAKCEDVRGADHATAAGLQRWPCVTPKP